MANKIIHKHSNVLTYDQKNQKTVAKLPSSSQLDYGELAINYARNYETISLKNSGNEIVEFKSKKYIDDRITETENKIEEHIQNNENEFNEHLRIIVENEEIAAAAITDVRNTFNKRLNEAEETTAIAINSLSDDIIDNMKEISLLKINKSDVTHTHGKITLTGDVSGTTSFSSGTTAYNITTTVGDDTHYHSTSTIKNTISKLSGCTTGTTGLAQGKVVKELSDKMDYKISGLQQSIVTLIGTEEGDDTKSVRNIAAEEVAKIVDDAPENYDTLKEIADYISSDATNAAAMVNDINFLKEITSGFTGENTIISVIEDNEETIAASITELENRMDNVEIGLETKSDIGHTHADYSVTGHAHDDIYYTEDEIDSMLLGYSLTAHTHNVVSSSANGFAPKVSDGGTIDNSSNDLVLTSDNGTVGWRKLPTNAFTDTDTKVTSPSNHYAPTGETGSTLTANASGASAAWSIDVVKGVTVERDSKGHITNLSVTSGKLPANPNTDTKVIQTVTTTNAEYPVLLAQSGQSSTTTGTTYFDSGITINPSTNTINATSTSSKKVDNSLVVKLNDGTTEGTNMFTFDGSTGKTVNVTAGVIGASSVNHAHGMIRLSGGVSGSGKITSGETAISITTTVANNSHSHTSANISDSVSAITSNVSTKLVQEKAVYNLVSDTEEQISEVLLDHYSQITGLTENITNLVTEIENNELVTATSITELEDRMDNVEIGLETKSDIGHTHISDEIVDSASAITNSTSSKLVQEKAVVNFVCDYASKLEHTHKGLYYTYDAGVIDETIDGTESAPSHIYIESTEITNQDGKLNGMLLDLTFQLSKGHTTSSSNPNYIINSIYINNDTEVILRQYSDNATIFGYTYNFGINRFLISIELKESTYYGYVFNHTSKFSDKLTNTRLIDGVSFDGRRDIIHYAVCNSEGSSAQKIIGLNGFEYTTGASIWVKFEKANTATSPYLTINGDTEKRFIRYGVGTAGANTQLNAGVWNLIWDGTVWRIHIPEMVNQSNKIKVQRWASATSNAMPLLFTNGGYANTSPDEPNNANNNTLSGALASTSGYSETYIAAIANKPLLYQPSTGVLYAGNAAVHVSDERLKNFKDDIQVDFNELKKIPKKYFTWKNDDNNELNIGTSAQELEKVYPELVSEYPEEGRAYKTVNYSNLSIIALAAIDKLNERIEYLETKLKYLENK